MGVPKMETGKYDNITLKQYHEMPGWSKSRLDLINRSPAHMIETQKNKVTTPAMAFGSALHCAVLTPALYELEYCVIPECDRRTKAGKELYAEFVIENKGKTVIDSADAANVELMKMSIFSHPLASAMLTGGEAEQSFFWIEPLTRLRCKARPDYLRHDGICIDLKTTDNATYNSFQRSMYKYRYHVQGAFFSDGVFQAVNKQVTDFVLIAIEKEPPFGIMVYRLDDLAIDAGRVEYKKNLATALDWEKCPESFEIVYPISEEPIELLLPAWAE